MPRTLIRNVAWAVTWAGRHEYRRDADVLLEDGKVAAITAHDPDAPPPAAAEVIDGRALLVLPGLVNVHTHPTTEPGLRGIREDHGVPEF